MKLLYSHLSPRPVDPTLRMSLLLLHSFHSHCPSTALILFSAQTDRIACLWPPALTSILHTAAICTPIVTHTHALPTEYYVQMLLHGFPEQLQFTPTCFSSAECPSCLRADWAQLSRTQLAAAADAHPLSQPQALLPHVKAQMECPHLCGAFPSLWCFPHFTVFPQDSAFDNRYFCPRV